MFLAFLMCHKDSDRIRQLEDLLFRTQSQDSPCTEVALNLKVWSCYFDCLVVFTLSCVVHQGHRGKTGCKRIMVDKAKKSALDPHNNREALFLFCRAKQFLAPTIFGVHPNTDRLRSCRPQKAALSDL